MAQAGLLSVQKHIRYCLMHLQMLPTAYESEDCSRMSLGFFVLSSLDLLNAKDKIAEKDRIAWIDWIYEQQCPGGGFSGGPSLRMSGKNNDPPHLAMTYTALANLAILGDNFSRVDTVTLRSFVQKCQMPDGSFAPYPESPERDIRFVYCAFVIEQFLGMDVLFRIEDAIQYTLRCQNYDGAFGQTPGTESQGGTTYCAIASLYLADRLAASRVGQATIRWLSQRLVCLEADSIPCDRQDEQSYTVFGLFKKNTTGGHQGRPDKDPDVCYSFWVGASLRLLKNGTIANMELLTLDRYQYFICAAQGPRGGVCKHFEEPPDIYHTYLGLAALALGDLPQLKSLNAAVNMSVDSWACYSSV